MQKQEKPGKAWPCVLHNFCGGFAQETLEIYLQFRNNAHQRPPIETGFTTPLTGVTNRTARAPPPRARRIEKPSHTPPQWCWVVSSHSQTFITPGAEKTNCSSLFTRKITNSSSLFCCLQDAKSPVLAGKAKITNSSLLFKGKITNSSSLFLPFDGIVGCRGHPGGCR